MSVLRKQMKDLLYGTTQCAVSDTLYDLGFLFFTIKTASIRRPFSPA